MNSNVIKTMPKIKLSKDAKNASFDNSPKDIKKDSFGEISDEEIKAFAMGYYDNNGADYYVELGAKWYREQLKLRQ